MKWRFFFLNAIVPSKTLVSFSLRHMGSWFFFLWGRGAFGEVWKALDLKTNNTVAIKICKNEEIFQQFAKRGNIESLCSNNPKALFFLRNWDSEENERRRMPIYNFSVEYVSYGWPLLSCLSLLCNRSRKRIKTEKISRVNNIFSRFFFHKQKVFFWAWGFPWLKFVFLENKF